MILEVVATFCAGLFAGAAAYVSFVEHPARLECGVSLAVREFGPSYRRGAAMQASLAVAGLLAAVAGWLSTRDPRVLAGGALLGSVVPFTLLVILPTNKRLLDPALDAGSAPAAALLARWGLLHAVRTLAGVAAFAILLISLP